MAEVYILEALRVPNAKKNGAYKHIIPEKLAAFLIKELINKYHFLASSAHSVILGTSLGTGGNMARYAALEAGLPASIAAFTIDTQCISGFQAIQQGYALIKAQLADCVIVGGIESTSLAPIRRYHPNDPRFDPEPYTIAQFSPNQQADFSLLAAAERCMEGYSISLEETFQQAILSHENALKSTKLVSRFIKPFSIEQDETLRQNLKELIQKKPSSKKVNLYTSADFTDGASILVLVSEKFVSKNTEFKIDAIEFAGDDPSLAPRAFVEAIKKLPQSKLNTVEAAEINESFAIKPLIYMKEFGIDSSKVNIFGGNLAYGHPFGASSVQNFIHLMAAMNSQSYSSGLVAASAAGGIGAACILQKVSN